MSQKAFLQAIIESPDDDALRLIYADWLEENSQPERAEFIRIRCELARMDDLDSRHDALWARANELFEEHGQAWKEEVPKLKSGYFHTAFHHQFVRGLVEEVTLWHWKSFFTQAETMFAAAPVQHVLIVTLTARTIRSLARFPLLARVRSLEVDDLSANPFGDDGVRALAESTYAGKLAQLTLGGSLSRPFTPHSARALAGASFRPSLKRLEINGSELGDEGVAILATCPWNKLVSLTLRFGGIGPTGATALAQSPHFSRLAELNFESNRIGLEGIRALADSLHLAALTRLALFGCDIPAQGIEMLATSANLPNLRLIHLNEGDLSQADQRRLRKRFGRRVCFGWE